MGVYTFKFDCNGHNSPAYGCNRPGDNSGEYVSLEDYKKLQSFNNKLVDALELGAERLEASLSNKPIRDADEVLLYMRKLISRHNAENVLRDKEEKPDLDVVAPEFDTVTESFDPLTLPNEK